MYEQTLEARVKRLEVRVEVLERMIEWAEAYDPEFIERYVKYRGVLNRMEDDCGK